MKYLKKFNEELSPSTYSRAAMKLKKLGHTDRANKLYDWSDKTQNKILIDAYSEYGEFKMRITDESNMQEVIGDFNLFIHFDPYSFENDISDGDNRIVLEVRLIPSSNDLLDECNDKIEDFESLSSIWLEINFDITKTGIDIVGFVINDYDNFSKTKIEFIGRSSANKFKNLLVKIFNDENFDYPSGYTNIDTLYNSIKSAVLIGSGFFTDYGLEMDDIGNYIKSISINRFYKQ